MLDAFKRASAAPHHRGAALLRLRPPGPQGAAARADLGQARGRPDAPPPGAQRVLALDLHAGQIQGFFDIPVDHLFAAPVVIDYLDKQGPASTRCVVSPDAGGVERARAIAKRLRAGLAIIDKRRDGPNVAVFMHLIGDVEGKDAIIIDDMIDTAGTLVQAADALKREGARRILACGVHAVLSGPAIDAHQGRAPRGARGHQLDPAAARTSRSPRSRFSRSRPSWRRRSGASTTRNRCPPCSSRRRARQGDGP